MDWSGNLSGDPNLPCEPRDPLRDPLRRIRAGELDECRVRIIGSSVCLEARWTVRGVRDGMRSVVRVV